MLGGLFVNCITAGNVLVQLFLQTQPKYLLNNSKLQYLLCIAQMSRLSYGETLFDDDMRNFKHSFVLDVISDNFVCNSAIVEGTCVNDSIDASDKDLVIPYSKQKIYALKEPVSESDKELLIRVFINFGSYNEKTLCNMLKAFGLLEIAPLFGEVPKDMFKKVLFPECCCENIIDNKVYLFCKNEFITHSANEKELLVAPNEDIPDESVRDDNQNEGLAPESLESESDCESAIEYKQDVLKKVDSISTISKGKNYCVLIEVDSNKIVKDVYVFSLLKNKRIKGTLVQLNNNLYRYSFVGVASDIRITTIVDVK